MPDVIDKYINARSLQDYIHSLDFDETYNQIVNLAYTTDIQFDDKINSQILFIYLKSIILKRMKPLPL